MKNQAIAELFGEIAKLLEFGKEENPFRIRAYQNASLSLRSISEDVEEIQKRGELLSIKGIGRDLAGKIEEYLSTGKIEFYQKLRDKTPPILLQMLQIPGMGPKTSKLIYGKFKPRSLEDLERIVQSDKFKQLHGVKEKTAQNILDGIAFIRQHHDRTPLGRALPIAREICRRLGHLKGVRRISYAGSTRRMCETVRDIDILVAASSPQIVMDAFIRQDGVERVLAHGPTKSSVILAPGIQADLRVVRLEAFGSALVYFTGSKAHNIRLRSLAKKKGFKVNEYGVFREKTGQRVAGHTEEEVYQSLGLDFIPPEMREDQGEIEAAGQGKLPRLLERTELKGDFHMHSNWTDGTAEIKEMAEAARRAGLEYAVLTDHSRSLKIAKGLSPQELLKQTRLVKELNKKWKGVFTLLIGSEVDILEDGSLDYENDVLKELDFVVASVHSRFKQDKKTMTRRIVKAMQNRYVRVIGHPTGRLLGQRAGYELDFEELFRAAKETNTALEINSQPDRLDLAYQNARWAKESGVMLAVDSDSHQLNGFENFEFGVGTARRGWCERKNILNCLGLSELRKRIAK